MSLTTFENVQCPCGEVFQAEIISSINAQLDPELKELLIGGELNILKCPSCSEFFYVEHFLLYFDPPVQLLAFIYPKSFELEKRRWENKMKEDFAASQEKFEPEEKVKYQPIIMFGLDSLVELLNHENDLADETEIVRYLSKDAGLKIIRIEMFHAREKKIPENLPCAEDIAKTNLSLRENVLSGLKKIIELSPELVIYRNLLNTISNDPVWSVSAIVTESKTEKKSK
ncbi:MAG: hypothetical protein A2252_11110 [Elusimicrobia bacterium RIFOXYA2_FULL_39_19]|nr:MAG: hypothetical protein A2252_11110 [Elusimicrobia bacterium RIFOXYA2_FULL_39_19]